MRNNKPLLILSSTFALLAISTLIGYYTDKFLQLNSIFIWIFPMLTLIVNLYKIIKYTKP